jgi:hypothetical protein
MDDLVGDLLELVLADHKYEELEKKLAELNFNEFTKYKKEGLKVRCPEISRKIKYEFADPILDTQIPVIGSTPSLGLTI